MKQKFPLIAATLAAFCVMGVPAHAQGRHQVEWSGDVDDTVIIHIHRDHVDTDTVRGHQAANVNSNVDGHLPDHPVHVWLEDQHGRGHIRIVQQPNPGNDFTAAVRVRDPQPGSDHYHFILRWNDDGPGNNWNGAQNHP